MKTEQNLSNDNGVELSFLLTLEPSFKLNTLILYEFSLLHLTSVHLEPDILECEVKWALGSITMNKASGGDGIPVELFQILEDDAVKVLHSVCQEIWKTQQWPQDWKRSVFIPIPKKGRFLPQLEMRPSSNAPNPVESREAPPTSSFPGFSEPP